MGGAKAWWQEQQERGFTAIEGNVCTDCFSDTAIKKYINENANARKCDFCDRASKKNIAAPLDDVMGVIMSGIAYEWNNPDNEGISYESAEGGYQAALTSFDELIRYYDMIENEKVTETILKNVTDDAWVERDFYIGSEGQRFKWAWDAFCHEVTYKKRFLFLHQDHKEEYSSPEISPAKFLYELADYKNRKLDTVTLIKVVQSGTSIYRVRAGKEKYNTAKELGPPPHEHASQTNRMSPAGIPMFYGAFDANTSVKETYDPKRGKKKYISIGEFHPIRDLYFLDLGSLPAIPSVFDADGRHLIQPLLFFHGFATDIAKPISRNGKEHIEYVPTQIVTEFFKHIYKTSGGQRLDGIIYKSSKKEDSESCVIFCENHQVCDRGETKDGCLLSLKKTEYKLG